MAPDSRLTFQCSEGVAGLTGVTAAVGEAVHAGAAVTVRTTHLRA